MIRDFFVFQVQTEVRFTKSDLDVLTQCSKEHYDWKCRSLSNPGGFLYGMRNALESVAILNEEEGLDGEPMGTWNLSTTDLDLLCKVTENCGIPDEVILPMHLQIRQLFVEADRKYREINAHLLPSQVPPQDP